MTSKIKSIKGTRDFYPEEMSKRTWLYANVRSVSEAFGYQEFEGPFLESIELYAAKSGDELVKEQSFVFSDRGGELIALRPELTPTLARMVAERQRQLVYPVRWWSFGPFWRYERPQKGRSREFFQWNIDLFGVATPEADAELVAIAAAFFQEVGLSPSQVKIMVNNRRLVDAELAALDIAESERPAVSRWIDRRDKMNPNNWQEYAQDLGLSLRQISNLIAMLDDKERWKKSDELVKFFDAIEALGCQDYVQYNGNIVRGLDYYTGTVFEAREASGDIRRSIMGGGRYDNLLAEVGGDPLPGVGFAMGDMVVSLVLEKYDLLPAGGQLSPAQVLVTVFNEETLLDSYALAAKLRQTGLNTAVYPEAVKLGKQFKFGDRIGARVAVILGPDEIKEQQASIKDLESGQQEVVPMDEAPVRIRQLLDSNSSS
jgi:histidyl-tRNA synthetase